MEYRVLGKLEVLRDGQPVDLGTFRQRALLALLLTAPNTVISTDQLIDRLWGEDPPGGDRQNSLWVYVSGLRKALEPDREKRTEGTILLTRPPGYLVHVDPDEVDAVRFERLVAEGQALSLTDPAAASLVLGEALALWRGRAYEDFTYESFAQGEINRLEELRVEAVDARIGADLDRGMSRGLVSELETGTWRYDLSDLMPPRFGAWTDELVPGPFWQGMLDWVDRVKPIDEILTDIEAARRDLESAGSG